MSGPTLAFTTFLQFYEERNPEAVMSMYSTGKPVSICGTGIDEKNMDLTKFRESLLRDWKQSEYAKMNIQNIEESQEGDVAWQMVYGSVDIRKDGKDFTLPEVRISNVLVKENGQWKFRMQHWSFPSESQKEGESFPASAFNKD